jgi:hypothetical protein
MSEPAIYRGHKIITAYVFPPIPCRDSDWFACTDNYDGAEDAGPQLIGRGPTEEAAINDLKAAIDDASEPLFSRLGRWWRRVMDCDTPYV